MNHLPDDLAPGTVTILGLPTDENSSFMHGAALAPPRIRDVLHDGDPSTRRRRFRPWLVGW